MNKQLFLKFVGGLVAMLVVLNLVLFAFHRITGLTFWLATIIFAVIAYWAIPRFKD
jgi:hypothetical protein